MIFRFYSSPAEEGQKTPRVTVVAKVIPDTNIIQVASARCSSKDRFSRKIWRRIDEGRLAKGKLKGSFE